jgi:hypothetical protein
VCSACHDSTLARSHMVVMGAALYEPRSTALGKVEQCFVCHADGKLVSITDVHAR